MVFEILSYLGALCCLFCAIIAVMRLQKSLHKHGVIEDSNNDQHSSKDKVPIPAEIKKPLITHLKAPVILLANDDDIERMLFRKTLEKEYEVLETADSMQVPEIIKDNSVDIVIMDVNMPEMTGFEVIEKIKLGGPIPIIIFTTNSDDQLSISTSKTKGIDYLIKPLNLTDVMNKIEEITERDK